MGWISHHLAVVCSVLGARVSTLPPLHHRPAGVTRSTPPSLRHSHLPTSLSRGEAAPQMGLWVSGAPEQLTLQVHLHLSGCSVSLSGMTALLSDFAHPSSLVAFLGTFSGIGVALPPLPCPTGPTNQLPRSACQPCSRWWWSSTGPLRASTVPVGWSAYGTRRIIDSIPEAGAQLTPHAMLF